MGIPEIALSMGIVLLLCPFFAIALVFFVALRRKMFKENKLAGALLAIFMCAALFALLGFPGWLSIACLGGGIPLALLVIK